jgi:hypothetical protein
MSKLVTTGATALIGEHIGAHIGRAITDTERIAHIVMAMERTSRIPTTEPVMDHTSRTGTRISRTDTSRGGRAERRAAGTAEYYSLWRRRSARGAATLYGGYQC